MKRWKKNIERKKIMKMREKKNHLIFVFLFDLYLIKQIWYHKMTSRNYHCTKTEEKITKW